MGNRIDTDGVLHSAMQAKPLEQHGMVDLEGDLYHATKEKQREERDALLDVIKMSAGEVRNEVVLHQFFGNVAHAVGAVSSLIIGAGMETIACALETIHEGEQLNDAVVREYGAAACAMLCRSALPQGFVADFFRQFVKKGEASPGAVAVYNTIIARPDADQIRAGMVANCVDGQRHALDRHITTRHDLETSLKLNPDFANRYRHDLAFKLGTDSVIWAEAHGQLPALDGQVPAATSGSMIEVRG